MTKQSITEKMTSEQISLYEKFSGKFPFPVIEFAVQLGIKIYVTDMPKNISGKIVKQNNHYEILLNESHGARRLRFTLAHELGHFFNDKNYLDDCHEITDESKQLFRAKHHNVSSDMRNRDVMANQFAAELLMPEDKFIEQWKKYRTPEEVANFFNVSTQAVLVRATVLLGEIF